MTGRRPKRSESAPSSGENRTCIKPQTVANTPKISAAPAVSPSMKPSTMPGSTGIITPSASTSSVTVQKMKASARRAFKGDNRQK